MLEKKIFLKNLTKTPQKVFNNIRGKDMAFQMLALFFGKRGPNDCETKGGGRR